MPPPMSWWQLECPLVPGGYSSHTLSPRHPTRADLGISGQCNHGGMAVGTRSKVEEEGTKPGLILKSFSQSQGADEAGAHN